MSSETMTLEQVRDILMAKSRFQPRAISAAHYKRMANVISATLSAPSAPSDKAKINALVEALRSCADEYRGLDNTEISRRYGTSRVLQVRKIRAALALAGTP